MNPKEKAFDYLKRAYHVSYYEQPINEMIDIAIKEAKIEMCNEIIGKIDHKDDWTADDYVELIEQQIRHLSNSSSDKSETHNSD